MNKSEIAGSPAGRTGFAGSAVGDTVDAVFEPMGEALTKGKDVRIVGFGTSGTRRRPTRTGRNPRISVSLNTVASTAPTFRPSKPLRDSVNAGSAS